MAVPRITAVLMKSGINSQFLKITSVPLLKSTNYLDFSTTSTKQEKYFTEKHEWVDVQGNLGTVGVSKYAADALGDVVYAQLKTVFRYAADALGDVVYAQLPEVGDDLEKGGDAGALESVKAASEVYTPVSGKVTEKNLVVEEGPALINQSPENEGWLFKLELSNIDEIKELMNEEAYKKYLESVAEDH